MKLDEDLTSEIQNVEKEIIELKLSSPKKINSIASNITNEVIKRLIGTDAHRKYVESMVPGSSYGIQFINKYKVRK